MSDTIIVNIVEAAAEEVTVAVAEVACPTWASYAVTAWTLIDGTYYATVTHARGRRFVPFLILRTDTGEVIQPRAVCGAINEITIEMPEELNLTVLVGY